MRRTLLLALAAGYFITASASQVPAEGIRALSGDWAGTVGWIATQSLLTGNVLERSNASKPLQLAVSPSGALSGTGFGCTFTGTLSPLPRGSRATLRGDVTASGCDQALFDGDFLDVRVRLDGASRLAIRLERESRDAQGSVRVAIEGGLRASAGAAGSMGI